MNELGNTPADKNYKPSGIISEEYPEKVKVAYLQGYEQAEKDFALTWEDIRKIVVLFSDVSFEFFDTKSANEMCEETLTRFKQFKEEQQ